MKATEELRNWSKGFTAIYYPHGQWLSGCCDRIDAEHAATVEAIKSTHIELPTDKNGKVIYRGSIVRETGEDDHKVSNHDWRVVGIGERTIFMVPESAQAAHITHLAADMVEVIEPDSQEKIDADVRDIAEEWIATAEEDIVKVTNDVLDLLRRQRELDGAK